MTMWHQIKSQFFASSDGTGVDAFSPGSIENPGERPRCRGESQWGMVAAAALAVTWIIFWYRDTAMAMEAIWSRSGTFAHGYLVAPISIWLGWRQRAILHSIVLRPSLIGFLAGLACGFTWLVAQLSSVDSVAQFALVGMVISTVWTLLGTECVRVLAFPLGFLFFSVPFGEFLFPSMMDLTTDFVVHALRLTGVPVFVEGRSLVIPSGHWEVVEGCSGVRYLIASVVVGSLYAYLNYRSMPRRLIFTAVAVVCPIVANWLRAYGIVLLGHFSGNRLATGVDHIIYGWVFFGLVMLGLFWIGGRWQEDGTNEAHVLSLPEKLLENDARVWRSWFLWIATVTMFSLWPWFENALLARGEHGPVAIATPVPSGEWNMVNGDGFTSWAPRYSGMTAIQQSVWERQGRRVGLFIGYYRDQVPGQELINSENRVLQNKDPEWKYLGRDFFRGSFGQDGIKFATTNISGQLGRLQVWQVYWIGERLTGDEYLGKAFLAFNRLAGRGDDSAVIMAYAWEGEEGSDPANQVLNDYFREMGPAISAALARTAER